ncbi:MAG: sialate O-acetylesterase [Prevotella sp.]|nr:sialate O-acetylesterase [Prevotella sp.]
MKKEMTMMLAALLCLMTAEAKVRLPQLFQDGMVLQRGVDVPVWGWADAGENVSVTLLDAKNKTVSTATATADDQGRWRLSLPKKKIKAGGPYTLDVKTDRQEAASLSDVLVGDVWLCSGQSNIDVTIERVYPWYTQEIDSYENAQVRLFRVQNETSTSGPKDDIRPTNINWKPLTKQNAWLFSAVGYFLGKRMQEETRVPQGIIVNSWGGTPIEAWVSADSLKASYPLLVEKTRLYDSRDYVRAQQQANQQADQQWRRLLDERDPGVNVEGEYLYTSLRYDDSGWETIDQNDWSWHGVGSTWMRQHVQIDKAHAGQPARLLLGTLFDADFTYVNGREVGRTYYQYPPRRYDIPEGLLREGDNVITVRFINKYGAAHFIQEKNYLLAFGPDRESQNPLPADIIPLSPKWKHHAGADMPGCPSSDVSLQNLPTTLYNAVLHPLAPYALAGVVWYQGESNTGNARDYAPMLRKLMGGWRQLFEQPQLPFVIVQLANYMACVPQPQNTGWSQVREAQRTVARDDAYAESVVNIDLGETVDIHPLRKKEVAERIGLCFDRLVYGKKVNLFPQVTTARAEGDRVVLTLDQPLRDGSLKYFELAGPDGRFHNAEATAAGNTITISVPAAFATMSGSPATVSGASSAGKPTAVRYAWKDNPLGVDAYSLDGLPLSPFELKL